MRGDKVGPLHGLPFAMKDCFDFKRGWVTTFGGIRALKDYVVDTNCMFVERMEQAGAITVGKTNSPVFGFRGTCDNYMYGPSKNPFDLAKNTGGSSGGSAGAVAAGLLPICEGTDGGGSIRIPASWCGVFGYKPSFGRVPFAGRPNAFGGTAPFLFEGPISRTVEDAALAMSVLAGYDSRDPYSIEGSVDFMAALRGSIAGKTIAYTRDYGIFPVDPRVIAVVDKAVKAFEEAGARVEEVKIDIRRTQREAERRVVPLYLRHAGRRARGLQAPGHRSPARPSRRPAAGGLALGRDRAEVDGRTIPFRPGRAQRGVQCLARRARPLRFAGFAHAGLPRGRQRGGPQHRRTDADQR
jgi:amidase/aspartyl-tRNA(Asn)/glutamyl-tRNA(Gln) amidotransferase subunit A